MNGDTLLYAANGKSCAAMKVFSHALAYFRKLAIREVTDHCGTKLYAEDIKWVITVPAMWRPAAKQFMREAAYLVGITLTQFRPRFS